MASNGKPESGGLVPPGGEVMTVGELSRRTGVPVKALRQYADDGLVYSVGRSRGNYRLFDSSALWCVQVINDLRGLGVTVAEIRALARVYLADPDQPIGPALGARLRDARARIEARIEALEQIRRRIDAFESDHRDELVGAGGADFRTSDPTYYRRGA